MPLTLLTGNIQNETHFGANYSLIFVNKTSGKLTFGWGESTFWEGEKTWSWGETTLSWSETTWGETDLGQNDLFLSAALASQKSAHLFDLFLVSGRVSSR